jgi:8-oxo-dGTP pyrophosphatase MutT (NUDIX family)
MRDRTPSPTAKEAAVLILLYERHGELWFPLTRRTETVETHKGQISLPGGARENGDQSLRETALRETCEELGVCPETWNVLGQLSTLYIPPSEFIISPYVAHTSTGPTFRPDPTEVADVIETPLSLLLDPATVRWEEWTLRDTPVKVPFFDIKGHKVWGATAMVLSEFVTVLREAKW